jgi:hypothetical protein
MGRRIVPVPVARVPVARVLVAPVLMAPVLMAVCAILVAGCAGQPPQPFVPGGGTSSPATASGAAGSASTAATVPGLRQFAFPGTVQVQFQTPLPAAGPQRAAMIGYENYARSMWYAVYTHGSSRAYQQFASGNALTFIKTLISQYTADGYTLRGTIVYYDTLVPSVYYGAGALVESCVNASGLFKVNSSTGQVAGTVFSAKFGYYQEQAAAGKKPNGTWWIGHTDSYPAADGGAAGMCG